MNIRIVMLLLLVGTTPACVFESGPSLPEPGADNNANNINNANNANNANNGIIVGELAVDPVECGEDAYPVLFTIPANAIEPNPLRPDSEFALARPNNDALPATVEAAAVFGWVNIVDENIRVAAGTLVSTDPNLTNSDFQDRSGAEVSALMGEEITGFSIEAAPPRETHMYKATVFTTDRVLECLVRDPPSESTCVDNANFQQILVENEVNPLASLEVVSFFERPEPNIIRATLVNLIGNFVFLGVGGPSNLRSISAVRVGGFGTNMMSLGISTLTKGRDFYGGRLTVGVTNESGGFPYLLMLAQDGLEDEPRPAVFISDGEQYRERTVSEGEQEWALHPDVAPVRSTFSFVARNEMRAQVKLASIDYDPTRSVTEFGYVGVGVDATRLFFATEEPIATGENVLVHTAELPIVELATGIGGRFGSDLVEHEPLIVLLDEDRDSLTLVRWGLTNEVEWVDGVGSKFELTDIGDLDVPPVHYDDATRIGFRARSGGEPVLGVLFVPEVSGLERSLCIE